jgi:hypothetical protein
MFLQFGLILVGSRQFRNVLFLVTAAIFDEVRTYRIHFNMGTINVKFDPYFCGVLLQD